MGPLLGLAENIRAGLPSDIRCFLEKSTHGRICTRNLPGLSRSPLLVGPRGRSFGTEIGSCDRTRTCNFPGLNRLPLLIGLRSHQKTSELACPATGGSAERRPQRQMFFDLNIRAGLPSDRRIGGTPTTTADVF